jgi:signal transduction histidine kinase
MSAVQGSAGLARIDAPRLMLIAAAAAVVGLAAGALVLSSGHFDDRTVYGLLSPLVGWSFVGTGLYAWRRRPESRFGMLMTVLGFTWFLALLEAANAPVLFTAGIVLGSLWGPVLAHVLLSFPSGRLERRRERALVFAAYVLVPLAPVPVLLVTSTEDLTCDGPCPENVLLVSRDPALAEPLLAAGTAVVMSLSLLTVGFLVARWRSAGASERRILAPLFGAGGVTLLLVVGFLATHDPAIRALMLLAFGATPFAFLAGLARADVAQARGVRSLVARLADLPKPADLRDELASTLGDPTLSLAFWVPEQKRYVDSAGARVELPAPGDPTRAVTEVELDGRRIAAIVHDAALRDESESVQAAGAATALLLDNQRLEAELRANAAELRASRARLVEAGDAERRRLERNLHDGAQSRLVALALSLRLSRGRIQDGSEQAVVIDAALHEVKQSLQELRELARGIHPAVLSERGLEPAVRSLAARSPVPVELLGAAGERLPAAVETAAYFVICEALTNVAKYAHANHAKVRMQRVDGRLLLEISDDGIGGASPTTGSGLHGLSDRVAALNGAFEVESPAGGGTRLRVEFPCT